MQQMSNKYAANVQQICSKCSANMQQMFSKYATPNISEKPVKPIKIGYAKVIQRISTYRSKLNRKEGRDDTNKARLAYYENVKIEMEKNNVDVLELKPFKKSEWV